MPHRNILIVLLAIAGILLSSIAAARLGVRTHHGPSHVVQGSTQNLCEPAHYLSFRALPEADNPFNALAIDPCAAR